MLVKCLALIAILVYAVPAQAGVVNPKALRPPSCGRSTVPRIVPFVIGGEKSKPGDWPWMAALKYTFPPKFKCGGTLISSRHVMTAAHCILGNEPVMVRMGVVELEKDGNRPIDVEVEERIVHPDYDVKQTLNDIAILKLKDEVTFTDYLHPVCLPLDNPLNSDRLDGEMVTVAGWGSVYVGGPMNNELMHVKLPVVNIDKCKEDYKPHPLLVVNDKMMCAGLEKGGKDSCQGDSGGPLMYTNDTDYYVVGIVSFGWECAEPNYPGVYTRVADHLDFINTSMEK
ncbi:venom protease-like [Hylaeus anthracinus]|uniref:venom protease-like n=1 Tax=Hylaeus anthracinus TaxID=313031 RepID=UPI0023B97153|nr:venom protease-like [Hylaeus anthracinus]